jgi:hypothetical protein
MIQLGELFRCAFNALRGPEVLQLLANVRHSSRANGKTRSLQRVRLSTNPSSLVGRDGRSQQGNVLSLILAFDSPSK